MDAYAIREQIRRYELRIGEYYAEIARQNGELANLDDALGKYKQNTTSL
ncbi:MAG: hypothetical protein FWE41_07935 [Coriobacteriia bacterium]|nr:hypothetical protein [Coriobacteriia bacterium]MCL2750577.1 hypothetical protein [Coriobacteriia bacterium]